MPASARGGGGERERGEAPSTHNQQSPQAPEAGPQHTHTHTTEKNECTESPANWCSKGEIFRHSKKRTRGVHAVPRVLLASSLSRLLLPGARAL